VGALDTLQAPGGWIGLGGQVTGESSNVPDVDTGTRTVPLIDDVDSEPDVVHAGSLGQMLRAERERRGIGLDQIEQVTHIRAAQLRAIEDDRLEVLPAEAYARGFVRAYAEELDIDQALVGKLFSQQWNALTQPEPPYPLTRAPVTSAPRPWRELGALAMSAAILLLIVSTVIFIWTGRGGSGHPAAQTGTTTHSATSSPAASTPSSTPPPAPPPAPKPTGVHLTIRTTDSTCWYEARLGSPTGRLLGEQTLAIAQSARLHGKRIWLRLGNPSAVRLRLNGHALRLPATADPVDLLVTAHGATPV
jgi:hypothetical protein